MFEDLSGNTYGRLTVIGSTTMRKHRAVVWLCRCSCGKEYLTVAGPLKRGLVVSCGCYNSEAVSIRRRHKIKAGQKYGRLTVLYITDQRQGGSILWKCVCDCGTVSLKPARNLIRGITLSCGCLRKERAATACKSDLRGRTFGYLTAIEPTEARQNRGVVWLCRCVCGNTTLGVTRLLVNGSITSCGCIGKGRSAAIYIMRSVTTGYVKFGISINVQRRLRALEIQLNDSLVLIGTMNGSRALEMSIHHKLIEYRVFHPTANKGKEWYRCSPQVLSVVDFICESGTRYENSSS